MFSDQQLLAPDFVPATYLRHTLQLPSYDNEYERLDRCVAQVDDDIRDVITEHHEPLLEHVESLHDSDRIMDRAQHTISGVTSGLDRLRHTIHTPYVQMQQSYNELANATAALDLMRRVQRYLGLAAKFNEVAQTDAPRACRFLHDLERVAAEGDITGIPVIDAVNAKIAAASASLRSKAHEQLRTAMLQTKPVDLGTAVQCFASLGQLGKAVVTAVHENKRDSLKIVVMKLDAQALQRVANENGGSADGARARAAVAAHVEATLQELQGHVSAVAVLRRVLTKKRDAGTQRLFSEIVTPSEFAVFADFATVLAGHVKDAFLKVSKQSQMLAIFVQEYARLCRSLNAFATEIFDSIPSAFSSPNFISPGGGANTASSSAAPTPSFLRAPATTGFPPPAAAGASSATAAAPQTDANGFDPEDPEAEFYKSDEDEDDEDEVDLLAMDDDDPLGMKAALARASASGDGAVSTDAAAAGVDAGASTDLGSGGCENGDNMLKIMDFYGPIGGTAALPEDFATRLYDDDFEDAVVGDSNDATGQQNGAGGASPATGTPASAAPSPAVLNSAGRDPKTVRKLQRALQKTILAGHSSSVNGGVGGGAGSAVDDAFVAANAAAWTTESLGDVEKRFAKHVTDRQREKLQLFITKLQSAFPSGAEQTAVDVAVDPKRPGSGGQQMAQQLEPLVKNLAKVLQQDLAAYRSAGMSSAGGGSGAHSSSVGGSGSGATSSGGLDPHSPAFIILTALQGTLELALQACREAVARCALPSLPSIGHSLTAVQLHAVCVANACTSFHTEFSTTLATLPTHLLTATPLVLPNASPGKKSGGPLSITTPTSSAAQRRESGGGGGSAVADVSLGSATSALLREFERMSERVIAPFFAAAKVTLPQSIDVAVTQYTKTTSAGSSAASPSRSTAVAAAAAGHSAGQGLFTRCQQFSQRFLLLIDSRTPCVERLSFELFEVCAARVLSAACLAYGVVAAPPTNDGGSTSTSSLPPLTAPPMEAIMQLSKDLRATSSELSPSFNAASNSTISTAASERRSSATLNQSSTDDVGVLYAAVAQLTTHPEKHARVISCWRSVQYLLSFELDSKSSASQDPKSGNTGAASKKKVWDIATPKAIIAEAQATGVARCPQSLLMLATACRCTSAVREVVATARETTPPPMSLMVPSIVPAPRSTIVVPTAATAPTEVKENAATAAAIAEQHNKLDATVLSILRVRTTEQLGRQLSTDLSEWLIESYGFVRDILLENAEEKASNDGPSNSSTKQSVEIDASVLPKISNAVELATALSAAVLDDLTHRHTKTVATLLPKHHHHDKDDTNTTEGQTSPQWGPCSLLAPQGGKPSSVNASPTVSTPGKLPSTSTGKVSAPSAAVSASGDGFDNASFSPTEANGAVNIVLGAILSTVCKQTATCAVLAPKPAPRPTPTPASAGATPTTTGAPGAVGSSAGGTPTTPTPAPRPTLAVDVSTPTTTATTAAAATTSTGGASAVHTDPAGL